MGRKNKYNNFPPRLNVAVGERCLLCQCNRQVRKSVRGYIKMGFWKMLQSVKIKGVNNQTGEEEVFRVVQISFRMRNTTYVGKTTLHNVTMVRIS